jgi:hypothetical protein
MSDDDAEEKKTVIEANKLLIRIKQSIESMISDEKKYDPVMAAKWTKNLIIGYSGTDKLAYKYTISGLDNINAADVQKRIMERMNYKCDVLDKGNGSLLLSIDKKTQQKLSKVQKYSIAFIFLILAIVGVALAILTNFGNDLYNKIM